MVYRHRPMRVFSTSTRIGAIARGSFCCCAADIRQALKGRQPAQFGINCRRGGCRGYCNCAGEALGDSLYEARLFVRGAVKSLGADCVEKEMRAEHLEVLRDLLERAGADAKPEEFKRYGSARQLYNFDVDNASAY